MSAVASVTNSQDQHWLTFRIGGQLYAAPLSEVSEVIRVGEVACVPGSADDVLGIRHLRGRIVPVLDGRRRLGLPANPPADPAEVRVVMLLCAAHSVGLRVDEVGGLLSVDSEQVAPPPPGRAVRSDDPVSGVLAWHDDFVALLDVARLCRFKRDSAHDR